MSTAGSVSKGCFAFKGKKKRMTVEDYLKHNKIDGGTSRRHSVYMTMWENIDTELQILQSNLNSQIFEDLLQFAVKSHVEFSLQERSRSVTLEIPTAALVTGVNTPDHGVMFANLVEMLRERVSPLVAILKSKDSSNVKATIIKTLSQLMDTSHQIEDEEEEDENVVTSSKLPLTLSSLASWYKEKYNAGGQKSPKKRKSSSGQSVHVLPCPPVIIVFEDLESFLPKILQDFVTISSNYVSQLPLVFVFGIATSVSSVHRLLPNQVSSLLCLEKFQAPPSSEYLSLVISRILMTPQFPFKLGTKVFQLLLDIFLYHDFSVLNFIKGLRLAMLDHYFNMPLSYLCCSKDEMGDHVKQMKNESVETLRQLPSFMRYVEQCSPKEQPDLLLNDGFTKDRIGQLLEELHHHQVTFFPVLRCLHVLVSKLPKHPLGKQLREVYATALASNVFESEEYTQALELLKMMSKHELDNLITQSLEPLTKDVPLELTEVKESLQKLQSRFHTLHEIVVEDVEENVGDSESPLPGKTTMAELRQRLLTKSRESQRKKLSPYELLRQEFIDYYHEVFQKYLVCPKNLPLYEILYYDSASTIRRHLNAAPRSSLQMALSNPQHYLQCHCCKSDGGQVQCSMPDVCIAYKLHLECGQYINLFDWMQAFALVVQAEDQENENDSDNPDKLVQARFIRAVSELQFLGFVKPTKRKTDHVARLTWGGC